MKLKDVFVIREAGSDGGNMIPFPSRKKDDPGVDDGPEDSSLGAIARHAQNNPKSKNTPFADAVQNSLGQSQVGKTAGMDSKWREMMRNLDAVAGHLDRYMSHNQASVKAFEAFLKSISGGG